MTAWGDDPELLATFRAEVEERLASLQAGLLALEDHASPRHVLTSLFRDAHTVKGSARMMGLSGVLRVAHAMEELLGAVRDGRFGPRRDLVDLLLASSDAIGRALPGGELGDDDLEPLLAALARAVDGQDPVVVPPTPSPGTVLVVPAVAPLAAPVAHEAVWVAEPVVAPLAAPAATGVTPFAAAVVSPGVLAVASPGSAALASPGPTSGSTAGSTAVASPGSTTVASPGLTPGGGRPRSDSVRVAANRVYDLLDVVGEADLGARRIEQTAGSLLGLAAEQARWAATVRSATTRSGHTLPPEVALALHRLVGAGDDLTCAVRGLRELVDGHRGGMELVRGGAMSLAMVPVRLVFASLHRLVREVAQSTGRSVRLETSGDDVEIDKQVLDGVAGALKHLVTNAVDHGCEHPEVRLAAGKPVEACVRVTARSVAGTVVLDVRDDGAGVDEARVRAKAVELGLLTPDSSLTGAPLLAMLFLPAFSTATSVTETSGRGVGLDVVRDAVEELGGNVDVDSRLGAGTTFTLTLPVTLGVLRCLLARVGDERYAVPVPGVVESLSLRDAEVHELAGATVVVRHGVSVPLLDLGAALGLPRSPGQQARAALVVRHGGTGSQVAWAVDRLEGERELVVKDLGSFLGRVPSIAGATIDGDGSVVCLLDLRELAERAVAWTTPAAQARTRPAVTVPARKPRVLVVEDSVGVRELERVILEGAGYQVETAVDGLDGASRLRNEPADLVLSDVEMPGMDGFALTRAIRRTKGWENVPVVIMTSRGEEHARQSGLEAGCSAYLLKTDFDQEQLIQTVRRLVGR